MLIATAATLLAAITGCGGADPTGPQGAGTKLILVTMRDSRFDPDRFSVQVGDSVTFRFVNIGTLRHEAVIGDQAYQDEHERQMQAFATAPTAAPPGSRRLARRHPGMSDPNAVVVEPGQTGEITYSFAKPGTTLIGCHEVGHYAGGMVATIVITDPSS